MIVEIEYYKGDILLSGKQISYAEFLRQVKEVESVVSPIPAKMPLNGKTILVRHCTLTVLASTQTIPERGLTV